MFERAYRWVVLATIVLVPLAYTPGLVVDFFNIPKITVLFVGVIAGGSLRVALWIKGAPTGARTLRPPAAGIAAAFLLSWMFSPYKVFGLLGLYSRFGGLLPYLAVVLFGLMVADAFNGRPEPPLRALVAAGAGVGAFGLVQMLFLGEQIADFSDTGYITSTVGHSNFTGGFLAVCLPLAVGLWIDPRTSRWGMAATTLIASGVLFTVSQGAWAAALVGIAVLLAVTLKGRPWVGRAAILTSGLVTLTTVGVVVLSLMLPHAYARLPGFLATATSRGFLWRSAAAAGLDRPIFGWGPNALALQGPLHRSVEDALLLNFVKGDDPHSLPLAVFGNLGLVGVAAFVILTMWVLNTWRERREVFGVLERAAFAAAAAYLVQSLVSVEEPTLRLALWVLIGAIACGNRPGRQPLSEPLANKRLIPLVALGAIASLLIALVVRTVFLPDVLVLRAEKHLAAGEIQEGQSEFKRALSLRDDTTYRRRFGLTLGEAILARRSPTAGELVEVRRILSYLNEFPDAQAMSLYAGLLKNWSAFVPMAIDAALIQYDRATQLDPHNPLLAVERGDVVLLLGRPEAVEASLEPFEELLVNEFPEYSDRYSEVWFSLAIARAQQGKLTEAAEALGRATQKASCRYLLAKSWLAGEVRTSETSRRIVCTRFMNKLFPDRQDTT